MFKSTIRLFWWNERIIQGMSKENYGDVLGRYLVEKISGKKWFLLGLKSIQYRIFLIQFM